MKGSCSFIWLCVANGVFTVTLDFGAAALPSVPRSQSEAKPVQQSRGPMAIEALH